MTHIHEYDRDPSSNAGNCRCGLHLESHRHPHPFTQAYRSNTCVCAQPADAPIHTDADTARPNPVYPEPQASGLRGIEAAREAVRKARGDDACPPMRQQNLDAAAAAIQRAEAAVDRVRALAEFTRNHTAHGRDDMSLAQHELACAILAALAEPAPAATQATEPAGWLHAGTRDLSITDTTKEN